VLKEEYSRYLSLKMTHYKNGWKPQFQTCCKWQIRHKRVSQNQGREVSIHVWVFIFFSLFLIK